MRSCRVVARKDKPMSDKTTDLIEDAREAIGMLEAFPDGPDVDGRITSRGNDALERIASVLTSAVDKLEGLTVSDKWRVEGVPTLARNFLLAAPDGLTARTLCDALVQQGVSEQLASRIIRGGIDDGTIRLGENLQLKAH